MGLQHKSRHRAPTRSAAPPAPAGSKIEPFELQDFLWAQLSARLSDELLDDLTCGRRLCDPADGTLDPDGFLALVRRVLARARAVRRASGARTGGGVGWARAASFRLSEGLGRLGGKGGAQGGEEDAEERDPHAQVGRPGATNAATLV